MNIYFKTSSSTMTAGLSRLITKLKYIVITLSKNIFNYFRFLLIPDLTDKAPNYALASKLHSDERL